METGGGQKYIMTKKNDIFSGFGQATTDGNTTGHTTTYTITTSTYSITNTTTLAATGMAEGGVVEEGEGDVLDLIETIDINSSNSTSTSTTVASTTATTTAFNNDTHEKERSADDSGSNVVASVVNTSDDTGKLLRSFEDIWHNIKVRDRP